MSLTEAEMVFAGAHETGINDILTAFFMARPRYLNYATPSLPAPPGTPFVSVPAIAFPGIPGGIQYRISLSIPVIDFDPDSSAGTSPLPVISSQFNVNTKVTITVGCIRKIRDDDKERPGSFIPIDTTLEVWGRGKPTVTYSGPGVGVVGFQLDQVEIVDITPDSLESVLECLILMILSAVLSNVQLPFNTLSVGAFSLILSRGPEVEDDQVKLYGGV